MFSSITNDQNRLGLYVHWPFCFSKCPYCDFNSHVQKDIDIKQWRLAYISELRWMAEIYKEKARQPAILHSVFFGGGTPTLMPSCIIEEILNEAKEHFTLHSEIEITAEANPSSSENKTVYLWGRNLWIKPHLTFLEGGTIFMTSTRLWMLPVVCLSKFLQISFTVFQNKQAKVG